MNFNFLNKKRKEEVSVFEGIDKKYNCEGIIEYIKRDLKLNNLLIESVFFDEEKNVVVKGVDLDDDKSYIITINEPVRASNMREFLGTQFYNTTVTIDNGNNHYIDYVFFSDRRMYVDKECYTLSSFRCRSVRYVNGDVSVIIEEPHIKYIVIKGDKKAVITTDNTNWRLDAVLQKLENLDIHEIYKTIKEVDNSLVLNLDINTTNDVLKTKEELSINNGTVTKYNKQYTENGVLVSLVYENGKFIKKTEIIEENIDELKSNDQDIEEIVVKIKTLN